MLENVRKCVSDAIGPYIRSGCMIVSPVAAKAKEELDNLEADIQKRIDEAVAEALVKEKKRITEIAIKLGYPETLEMIYLQPAPILVRWD